MTRFHRCLCTLLLFILELAVFQTASGEGYLYLFKKSTGDFAAVEALQEETDEDNLKLTTMDGKTVVWGANLLVCKFPRFDEAKESKDPNGVPSSIAAIEKFIEQEPDSLMYLKGLLDQQKEFQARLETKVEESNEVVDEALKRFLADPFNEQRNYSPEYLTAKLKRGDEFQKLSPENSAKITAYLQPWAEEKKNRDAGLVRFEGKWTSLEEIARVKAAELEMDRKTFFEKELLFQVPQLAISEQIVYIVLGVLAVSVLFMLALLLHGLVNISQGFGLGSVLALIFGLGGLAAYGYGGWLLFEKPDSFETVFSAAPAEGAIKSRDNLDVDEWIFRIKYSVGKRKEDIPLPDRFLLEDAKLNTFLEKYLKVQSNSAPGPYAVTRKGLKVRVLVDRILVFDELVWFKKDVTVCYSFPFAGSDGSIKVFNTSATGGNLPLPGKVFQYLWDEVQPVMASFFEKSQVLANYQIDRVESGTVEMSSYRSLHKPASGKAALP